MPFIISWNLLYWPHFTDWQLETQKLLAQSPSASKPPCLATNQANWPQKQILCHQTTQSDPVRILPTDELGSYLPPIPSRYLLDVGLCSACILLNTTCLDAPREQPLVSEHPARLLAGSGAQERATVLSYLLVEDVQGLLDVLKILPGRVGLL